MNPENITNLIALAVTVLACIVPAVWHLSAKIQKIAGDVVKVNAEVSSNLKVIEVRINAVSEELKAAREARAKLWQEINGIRERLAKVEVEKSG